MSTHDNSDKPNSLTEKLMTIPWVASIRQTDRPDATHIIDLQRSTVSINEEIHELQQHGVRDVALSKHGDYGLRIYAELS